MDKPEKLRWKWQQYFSSNTLILGRNDEANGKLASFEYDPSGVWAQCTTVGNFDVHVYRAPTSYSELLRYPAWNGAGANGLTSLQDRGRYFSCNCSIGATGQLCRHLASLMFRWEKLHGPFEMVETEADHARRLAQEELERQRALEEQRLLEEKKRELKRLEALKNNLFPAVDYVQSLVEPAPRGLFYSPDAILRGSELLTSQYDADLADKVIAEEQNTGFSGEQYYASSSESPIMQIEGHCGAVSLRMSFTPRAITELSCQCGRSRGPRSAIWLSDREKQGRICGHALAVWLEVRKWLIRENPGDATDYTGIRFLSMLADGPASAEDAPEDSETAQKKRPCLCLTPRITRERNTDALKLNFDIGYAGARAYALKSLDTLVRMVSEERQYAIAKNATLDFATETFTDESTGWYQLILSRVRLVHSMNERLNRSFYNTPTLSSGTGIPLEASDLDIVYDMLEGSTLQYQYGSRSEVCSVRVCKVTPRAEITLDPVFSDDKLTGIAVSGAMPRLLHGNLYQYVLDKSCFGRVEAGGTAFLGAMQALSDADGAFKGVIGIKKLAEFYYRVLPTLQDNPQVAVTDNVGGLIDGLLPTEPRFTFLLDLGDRITCGVQVAYDETHFSIGLDTAQQPVKARDVDQERRVTQTVNQFFPYYDHETLLFSCDADDDQLIYILTDGLNALSQYGEVKGSDAFNRIKVKPAPAPRFSVQLDGGLLDLSIQTRDMTEEELLELLASYRLKKRWHRLKSGDFVDLRDASGLQELDETSQAMDTTLEAMIRGEVHVPKYRALYVDKLLEEHNNIATSRDRLFKSLIRSFQTIRDSDFEASEALMDVLRPYQLYGFRWLATLSQAGFGGILADEMGLGKTLQMLAFLQMQRDHGENRPALVVCPASLVYNWREECRRFTPDLGVETLAGNLRQRKAQLADMTADLYITSYDLLKRDIALYDGLSFSTIVLDEAQYIKNHRAAVSKAVRILKGEHRFALTGTPIENRLSELWSIFDFLMPGFLYTATEFGSRFEGPIMKQKDAELTARLSRMTAPFILRRKKTDVLKDLPEKLEETQTSVMEEDQRKLYDAQLVRMKAMLSASGNSGEEKLRILAEITRLRQLCCDPSLLFADYQGTSAKRAACLELIQNAIDAGHRMLVFSQFTSMLALLEKDLQQAGIACYKLTGSTPKAERIRLVNAFNDGDTPVFLISLKAGGTGLNLTGADVVIHYDPWWNLAVQTQATDRAHRIGQKRQVTVVKLIAADTIEERIARLQETKRELADAIISGENTSLMSLSREELMELLG